MRASPAAKVRAGLRAPRSDISFDLQEEFDVQEENDDLVELASEGLVVRAISHVVDEVPLPQHRRRTKSRTSTVPPSYARQSGPSSDSGSLKLRLEKILGKRRADLLDPAAACVSQHEWDRDTEVTMSSQRDVRGRHRQSSVQYERRFATSR